MSKNPAPGLPVLFTPPERRTVGWFVGHVVRNTIGLFPLIGILVGGMITCIFVVPFSIDGWGYRYAWWLFVLWARSLLSTFGVRVWVEGLENLEPGRQYIVCPNHRSHLDVPTLGATLPLRMVSVHKKSLEYIPFVGIGLWLSRSIGVDRQDTVGSQQRLKAVAQRLATGRSVVIFPEGRRSKGDKLEVFKKGAAMVALEQHAPILPVTVVGTDVLYPPNQLMICRGDALVVIHKPIETTGMSTGDRDALTQRIKETVASRFVPGPLDLSLVKNAKRVL